MSSRSSGRLWVATSYFNPLDIDADAKTFLAHLGATVLR